MGPKPGMRSTKTKGVDQNKDEKGEFKSGEKPLNEKGIGS